MYLATIVYIYLKKLKLLLHILKFHDSLSGLLAAWGGDTATVSMRSFRSKPFYEQCAFGGNFDNSTVGHE